MKRLIILAGSIIRVQWAGDDKYETSTRWKEASEEC